MTTVKYKTLASIELPNPLYDLCKAVTHDNRRALAVFIANSIEKLTISDAQAILDTINPLPEAAEDPPRAPLLTVIEKTHLLSFLELPHDERHKFISNLRGAERTRNRPELLALLEYLQGV